MDSLQPAAISHHRKPCAPQLLVLNLKFPFLLKSITWSQSSASSPSAPTSDEVLLGQAVDARQVAAVLPAVLLGVLPGVSPAEVPVAVPVKLPPRVVATLSVCGGNMGKKRGPGGGVNTTK